MKVLLVDDHVLVRSGIRRLLEDLPGLQVIAEADNGEEAMEIAKRERPDLVVTDIGMPGVTGLDLTAWLTRHQPDVRVVILSMHSSSDYVLEAFQAGARAYLLKHSAPAELALALRAIQAGDTFLSPGVSAHMAQAYLRGAPAAGSEAGRLTPRQRQVLKLLAGGKSTKQIAAILGLSPRTVETHRADLMERLGAKDAMSLLREAAKLGLVDVADPL